MQPTRPPQAILSPTAEEDPDVNSAFERLEQVVDELERNVADVSTLMERVAAHPALFDQEDKAMLQRTQALKTAQLATLRRETERIQTEYNSNVSKLEAAVASRVDIIGEHDIAMEDPDLREFFLNKQTKMEMAVETLRLGQKKRVLDALEAAIAIVKRPA